MNEMKTVRATTAAETISNGVRTPMKESGPQPILRLAFPCWLGRSNGTTVLPPIPKTARAAICERQREAARGRLDK